MINKFGSDLIEVCKSYSLRILNGRTGSDKQIGEYTFIGPNGNSVIDYGICSVDLYKCTEHFEIGTRTESCHSPIIITYDLKDTNMIYSENEDYAELRTKYIFDRNNINQFKERITDISKLVRVQNLVTRQSLLHMILRILI